MSDEQPKEKTLHSSSRIAELTDELELTGRVLQADLDAVRAERDDLERRLKESEAESERHESRAQAEWFGHAPTRRAELVRLVCAVESANIYSEYGWSGVPEVLERAIKLQAVIDKSESGQ